MNSNQDKIEGSQNESDQFILYPIQNLYNNAEDAALDSNQIKHPKIISQQSNLLQLDCLKNKTYTEQNFNQNQASPDRHEQEEEKQLDTSPIKNNDRSLSINTSPKKQQLLYKQSSIFSETDNNHILRKETGNLNCFFQDMRNGKGQTYNTGSQSQPNYQIQVQYKYLKYCFCGEFNIEISNEETKEKQFDWVVSYCFRNYQWIMSNNESQDKIVYNHPYFIITDSVAWKQYKYKFKKPYCCENAELLDKDNKTIITFQPKGNEIWIKSDYSYLKFLIPISVFIDQKNLDVYI